MSAEPAIVIRLDGDGPCIRPGETLSGHYWITSFEAGQVKAIESLGMCTPKARATRYGRF